MIAARLVLICIVCLYFVGCARAQVTNPPDLSLPVQSPVTPVQPDAVVLITGTLKAAADDVTPVYPLLAIWIDGRESFLRVSQVKGLLPAYPAEQELRSVSGLGLRLVGEKEELAPLSAPGALGRSFTIEGLLFPDEGRLSVKSVRAAPMAR